MARLPLGHDFWIRCGTTDLWTFFEVFFRNSYRCTTTEPKVIIDCGAHIGIASVNFARRYPQARILSVEPNPDNFALLKRNTAAYPNIECLHRAVYGHNGTVSLSTGASYTEVRVVSEEGNVPCFTVPTLLEKLGSRTLDIVKIDIEGSERSVFDADTAC
jgi:FkbM family methyltransferase